MNDKRIYQALDGVARQAVTENLDLRPRILEALHTQECAARQRRTLRLAAASALVALVIIAGSVPDVAQAVRQGLGFIPGFGLVGTSSPGRRLAAPVSQTRAGVTVTIEQATLSADRTVIEFSVTGLPSAGGPQAGKTICAGGTVLRLPDGKEVSMDRFNALQSSPTGAAAHASFTLGAVPSGADRARLSMACIPGAEESAAPSNWEFDLNFTPSEPGLDILPMFDATAQVSTLSLTATIPNLISVQTATPADGIHLQIDRVVPQPEGDLIYASIHWDDSLPYSTFGLVDFHLTDASGALIPLQQVSPDPGWQPEPGLHEVPLAFQIKGKAAGLLTLTASRLSASLPVSGAGFSFNPGPAPQTGQVWQLAQEIQAGSFTLRAVSVERTTDGYEFTFQNPPVVACEDLAIEGHPSSHGSCGSARTSLAFDAPIPTGPLSIQVTNLEVILTGKWQAVWTPK